MKILFFQHKLGVNSDEKGLIDDFSSLLFTEKPPAFACHKTESHTIEGRVTYNGCNVPTKGMDANSGIFTVNVSIFTMSEFHLK